MARPKIYVCRPLPEKALALLRGRTEMRLWEQNEIPPPREVLLREVADIDGLLSLLTDRVDGELLDRAPRLRVVCSTARPGCAWSPTTRWGLTTSTSPRRRSGASS